MAQTAAPFHIRQQAMSRQAWQLSLLVHGKRAGYLRWVHKAPGVAEVESLVVEETLRRRGYGSALVQRAFVAMRGQRYRRVDCIPANAEVAVPFWKAQGFQPLAGSAVVWTRGVPP